MEREDYRNAPTDYVIKRAFAILLVFIGWMGVVLGICIHFFGIEEGLYLGLWVLSSVFVVDIGAIEKPSRRRAVVAFCLAVATLSAIGAFQLHQYYLLFGTCFLIGLTILFVVKRTRVPNIRRDK